MLIRQAIPRDIELAVPLIFSTDPTLFLHLFKNERTCMHFLRNAFVLPDGQYSARRHTVIERNGTVIGIGTLWHQGLPEKYHRYTVSSLTKNLSANTLADLVACNRVLEKVFAPPLDNQICIGHFAVNDSVKRSGAGTQLFKFLVDSIQPKKSGKDTLCLDVDSANAPARNFYVKMGLTKVSTAHYAPTQQHFERMQMQLI